MNGPRYWYVRSTLDGCRSGALPQCRNGPSSEILYRTGLICPSRFQILETLMPSPDAANTRGRDAPVEEL